MHVKKVFVQNLLKKIWFLLKFEIFEFQHFQISNLRHKFQAPSYEGSDFENLMLKLNVTLFTVSEQQIPLASFQIRVFFDLLNLLKGNQSAIIVISINYIFKK
jgi:hypothetical protein